jgi:hypothetical protein
VLDVLDEVVRMFYDSKRVQTTNKTATSYALMVFAWLSVSTVLAQTYSIDWMTIDGGGGTSTGGVYSVSGTIGQPDAGTMSGGTYTLDGGFWGIIAAVQSPGAPLLRIVGTTSNTVVVAWPSPSTGFNLQQNFAIGTTNWSDVTNAVSVVGSENQIIVAPAVANKFFRLFHP